jgi:pimeloyl-ACP methyl ester carboxylesterase
MRTTIDDDRYPPPDAGLDRSFQIVSAAPSRRRRRLSFGRLTAVIVALLGVPLAGGAAYEAIASLGDASTSAPAGQLVDVGGYRLHLDCRGEGGPTIVMDSGLGGSALDWVLVQDDLATLSRVCTYDRAGMGWSDAGPLPRSPSRIADELHLLLSNAGISGPYILVAHSLAGKNMRMFAAHHPADVAGMVLVDARSERLDVGSSPEDVEAFANALEGEARFFSLGRRFGLARLFGADLLGQPLVPRDLATTMVLLKTNPAAIEETVREGLARSDDDAELADTTLSPLPLVVIAAAGNMRDVPGWSEAQQGLAGLSTAGELVVAEHSQHYVQLEEPGLVIDSVRRILAATSGEPSGPAPAP